MSDPRLTIHRPLDHTENARTMGKSPAKAVLDDLAAIRQKQIDDIRRVLIGELAEVMPEWQAENIEAAIERLVAVYLGPRP